MSNFQTFAIVTEGNISTAPNEFIASTSDTLADILAAGYMNDLSAKIKLNDLVSINYNDQSVFPLSTGESSILGSFRVNYDPTLQNWNLLATSATPSGIAALGVHSNKYTNAGGSATTTIVDGQINPNMIVVGAWSTSANAVAVDTIVAGVGQLTVVSSGDPGASVFSYIAFVPSLALQSAGVYPALYNNAGGSTTITITDSNITTAMVAEANFQSQANASIIQKVTVGSGTLTILCSANPGVSVVQYVASLPSADLKAAGLYSASYANAGGSATTTITDANITAKSVAVANWEASTNAVNIEKVTATGSTLTILSSADPGASTLSYSATPDNIGGNTENYLISTNNLSDVANAATSLANLGGLPLAGGQMTGLLLMERGTATSTAGAATINKQVGIVTTEALTTASGSAYSFTYTNSRISSTSMLVVQLLGGTNTKQGLGIKAVPGSGTATITFLNNDISAAALNGTLIFGVLVL